MLTVQRSDLFPVGTLVKAFALPTPGVAEYRPVGEPSGKAVHAEDATVNAEGAVSFAGLEAGQQYVLWASVGGSDRYLYVRDAQASSGLTHSSNTFSLPGAVAAETLPGPEVNPAAGEVQRLVRVGYRLREPSGGTATFSIQRNGTNVPGMTNLVAANAVAHAAPAPVTLAAGDELSCVIASTTGASPKGLSVTLQIEHEPAR